MQIVRFPTPLQMFALRVSLQWMNCPTGTYQDGDVLDCVTASACEEGGKHVYAVTRSCAPYAPARSVARNKDGTYSCAPSQYLVFAGTRASCGALEACDGLYLAVSMPACGDYWGVCASYFFSFPFDGDRKLCVSIG